MYSLELADEAGVRKVQRFGQLTNPDGLVKVVVHVFDGCCNIAVEAGCRSGVGSDILRHQEVVEAILIDDVLVWKLFFIHLVEQIEHAFDIGTGQIQLAVVNNGHEAVFCIGKGMKPELVITDWRDNLSLKRKIMRK